MLCLLHCTLLYESVFKKLDESDNFNIQKFVVEKVNKSACFKWTYGFSSNDYRVATLSKPNYYRNHHAKFETVWQINHTREH